MSNSTVVTRVRDILGPSIDQIFQNNRGNLIIRRCQIRHDTMTCENYETGIKSLLDKNGIETTVIKSMLDEDEMLGKHFVTELKTN